MVKNTDSTEELKSSMMRFETREEEQEVQQMSILDMIQIYEKSYDVLNWVFLTQFKKTKEYQNLVIQMNENMIEYRFYYYAGFQVEQKNA